MAAFTGSKDVDPVIRSILFDFRLTKALTCVLAGGGLALGGLFMQTLFRNVLAGPDVFGLSSGASLFVALVLMTGSLPFFSGPFGLAIAASMGSIAVFVIVFGVSLKVRDNTSLLLIGLMIGAAVSSVVSVIQFVSTAQNQHFYLIWTFGSLNALEWNEIVVLGIIVAAGVLLGIISFKSLNAWLLGDRYAQSMGIRLQRSRLIILIATCIITGGVTAFCGPIAFVGIAVPHLARLFMRSADHKILVPATLLIGPALMLFCDIIAQAPGGGRIIPINAITALIGAPIVIAVIVRSKRLSL